MKCKSWSNKFNNFVVRRLKSLKINGQQQVLSSTMPAMPKEKSPVTISESPYTDIININMTAVSSGYLGTSKVPNELLTSITSAAPNNSSGGDRDRGSVNSSTVLSATHQSHFNNFMSTTPQTSIVDQKQSNYRSSMQSSFNGGNSASTNERSSSRPIVTRASAIEIASSTSSSSASFKTVPVTAATISATPLSNLTVNSTTTVNNEYRENESSSKNTPLKSTKSNQQAAVKKTPNDFIFGKYIGEGSYSTVYLAKDVHTNKEYAIKVCDKQHILRERKQEYIRREREVMHMLNNVPGFVNLSCTFQDSRNLYFVMTYAKNSDLLPYINRVGSFDLECTCHYAAELVLAIEQMHKRGIVHRDLKPENILLDENMHTLIADFGSAKILDNKTDSSNNTASMSSDDSSSIASTNSGSSLPPAHATRRRGSFVGTAQYVSPEVLQGKDTTKAADLWALGCIIYQMTSGLPPFRGSSDYLIFREIMNLNLVFPEGFDKNAEDLVRKLLKLNPEERLGAQDKDGRYESIRTHPFFEGINWDTIRMQKPPPIYPYLPGVHKDEELRSDYFVPHNLEPGLDDRQLSRLLGLELGTATTPVVVTAASTAVATEKATKQQEEKKTESKSMFNLSEEEKIRRLDLQRHDKWNPFCDGEVILKKGFVNKRKGLFARKRMLLLTTGPRLIYVDPVQMVKKGEIPWSVDLRVEPKNFKIFFVHTPNRTYYLEDPEGYALEWVNEIENVRQKVYGVSDTTSSSSTASTAATSSSSSSSTTSIRKVNRSS